MHSGNNLLSNSASAASAMSEELAAILSGLIGGVRYGLKIRVPHAVGEFLGPSAERGSSSLLFVS